MVEGGSILHADHPRKWVIFARRFTVSANNVVGIAIILTVLVRAPVILLQEHRAREMATDVSEVMDSLIKGESIDPTSVASDTSTPQGRIAKFFKEYAARRQGINEELGAEFEKIDVYSMLEPVNLANTDKTRNALLQLEQLKTDLDDFKQRLNAEAENAERWFEEGRAKPYQDALRGFRSTKDQGMQITEQSFSLLVGKVDAVAEVLEVAVDNAGYIFVDAGQLVLADNEQVERYKVAYENLEAADAEFQAFVERTQATARAEWGR